MAKTGSITITQGTQNVANNTTPITVTGIITTTGESYRGDSRTGILTVTQDGVSILPDVWDNDKDSNKGEIVSSATFTHGAPAKSTTTLFIVQITVKHKPDGSSGTIAASYNYDNGWCTASTSKTLTKIPRQATISSAPDFNDTQNPTIKYSNPAGSAVSSLQACIANTAGSVIYVPYRNISTSGNSYTFELTDAERNALIAAVTSGYSQKIKFYVKTVISNTTFYATSEKTFSLIEAVPTLNPSVVDVNENTIALTGNAEVLVRYFSHAQVDSRAETYKGAIIKSQKVICGNKSIDSVPGIIEGVGSNAFLFSLTDSRNNPVSDTKYAKGFIEYINLTCNLNANAPDAEGDMTFSVSGNCFSGTFGAVDNAVKVYYRYKANNDEYGEEWLEAENVVLHDDNTYIAEVNLSGLDYQNRYTFQAMAVDKLMDIESVERIVKTVPVFDWGENDFNFNVPVTIKNVSLIDLIYPIGKIYMSVDSTNPEELFVGTKWEAWGSGRVPVGVDQAQQEFAKVEQTGGEKTHTLTTNEMPSHRHNVYNLNSAGNLTVTNGYSIDFNVNQPFKTWGATMNMGTTGGSQAHNNLQPYITCYMWKRIA